MRLTSVQRGLVEHQRVLYVVAAVAHDCHRGVLARRELFEVDQLDGLGLHHGLLRVAQQVHERVDAVPLVVADGAFSSGREDH